MASISGELVHLSCKIKDLALRNDKEVRRSARIAEEDERKYEQTLERAREADRLERENLQLIKDYNRWRGVAQTRATEITRLNKIVADLY